MTEESEWRTIDARMPGECRLCKTAVQVGEKCLYSWKQKAVWCKKCAELMGHALSDNSSQKKDQPSSSNRPSEEQETGREYPNYDTCSLCGKRARDCQTAFTIGDFIQYRVCGFCARVLTCQAHAKMAGLWVVPRKPKTEAE